MKLSVIVMPFAVLLGVACTSAAAQPDSGTDAGDAAGDVTGDSALTLGDAGPASCSGITCSADQVCFEYAAGVQDGGPTRRCIARTECELRDRGAQGNCYCAGRCTVETCRYMDPGSVRCAGQ